ncbi:hypothetical protein CF326_g6611 [Tilletia indica]|uniref:mitochondrial processing peptidase n=1 Tax=Tilletia indica TaxID=43049 RepID=A0A8T8SGZ0_9BASI|nr:hypothetical protein CF326_g6611 [Tilletia indica]KAE8240299.1 hypothetical protein A4X13_0g7866 [Tilletia indica]
MPTCNLAIAVEGVSWKSTDYFTMLVFQSILGNWDRSLGSSPLLSSRLSHIISSNNLANSFMHFSTSYSDTGLWGIYLVSENHTNLDDMAQLRASLLLGLDGTTAITEDIGRQLVTVGKRFSPEHIEAEIEKVDVKAVQAAAQKYLWDQDIAIAALGRTEGLLDYQRIRADMSSMTW